MKVLLIGCDKMGGAMLRQWVGNDDNHFTAVDPAVSALREGVKHVSKATELTTAEFGRDGRTRGVRA